MKFKIKALKPWAKQNEPTLWAVGGVVVWATATVIACYEAIELNKEIEALMTQKKGQKLPKKEVSITVAKRVAVPVILAACGTAMVFKGNNVSIKRTAAVTSLLTAAESKIGSLTEAAVETVGQKKAQDIEAAACQKEINKNPVDELEINKTGKGTYLFKLDFTGQIFRSSIDEVQRAVNTFNKRWIREEYQSLADLQDDLNIDRVGCSDILGWHNYDVPDDGITFDKTLGVTSDEEPCWVLKFSCRYPRENYWEIKR